MIIECYDIGGTKIKGALIKKANPYEMICQVQVASERGNPSKLLEQIKSVSKQLRSKANQKIDAVSMGFPGPVKNGILQSAPPLHINAPLDIRAGLGAGEEPVFVDNDLNMAVMAELYFGNRPENFYLLALSTGIGAGIVINGRPMHGSCGEFGHDMLERSPSLANKCSCGRLGCWVAQASGYGIEETAKKQGMAVSCQDVFESAKKGSKWAIAIVETAKSYTAHGIGNMLNAFPADAIVVMGTLGIKQFKSIIPPNGEIKQYTINSVPEITATKFGEDIGIIGAYAYAISRLK
ncbi:MAG TPA: ROK family protein [Nanoarchaeota archaeon]|nr:ROK family protein [Nanoarchaeota archaeon]